MINAPDVKMLPKGGVEEFFEDSTRARRCFSLLRKLEAGGAILAEDRIDAEDDGSATIFAVVEPYTLKGEFFAPAGRLVMAMAQIDDALTLRVFQLSGMTQATGAIVVGQMSISKKLDCIRLLERNIEHRTENLDKILNAIKVFNRVRNAICHGVFLGRISQSGKLAFAMRANVVEPVDGVHAKSVVIVDPKVLRDDGMHAENLADAMYDMWKLRTPEMHPPTMSLHHRPAGKPRAGRKRSRS